MKKTVVLILFLLVSSFIYCQAPAGNSNMIKAMKDIRGRVYGKLIDANTKKPIEFASVVVLWFNKDSLMGGGLTEENGEFNIENLPPMGTFRLKATQIGFKPYLTKIYIQIPNKLEQDLGDIALEADEKLLSEVEVTAEKSTVTMSIDKRTYNVDKDISVRGGTAVDVMKNVPGVTVDGDGNAQLRNQSPTIFVDGRPTNLTLQQIPADQIDRVEIITNPSVRYDASATGGILNIIMKKNQKPGYNGMAMASAGTGDRYGGMLSFNLKQGRWNLSTMYNYNQAINVVKGYTKRTQFDGSENVKGFFNQNVNTRLSRQFHFAKIGLDYALNNRNTLSFNQMLVAGNFLTNDKQDFTILDSEGSEVSNGLQVNDQQANFRNFNSQLQYKRTYPKAGKELTADLNYNHNNSGNGYLFTTYRDTNTYKKNTGTSGANQYVVQVDFINPLGETRKIEMGIKSFYKNSTSINTASNATQTQDIYTRDTNMSNSYIIDDMVNAAYVNYSDQLKSGIGVQAGLRFEQSYYHGNITDKNETFSYNYPSGKDDLLKSIFPGVYFSKKFSKNREWQLNFSRKIQRPNFFQLMPVVMFADPLNYRIGNPQLKPEFRNLAELNFNQVFSKGNYLGSFYFRYDEQPITDVAIPSIANPNVLMNTTVNGENGWRYGTEHSAKYTFFKNLDVTLNANIFYISMKGYVVPTEPQVVAKGVAWNAKTILNYRFPKQLTLQVNGNYESPRVLLLGHTLPVYSADISLNKIIGTKWTLNLMLSDIFNTRRMGTHYQTPYYVQDLSRRREARYLRFSVTYMFGKMDASVFKRAKQNRNTNDNQGNQDGLDFGR